MKGRHGYIEKKMFGQGYLCCKANTVLERMEVLVMQDVPICEKFLLTVREASLYFHIGEKKIRWLLDEHSDIGLAVQYGSRMLIKRKKFEKFLDAASSL